MGGHGVLGLGVGYRGWAGVGFRGWAGVGLC